MKTLREIFPQRKKSLLPLLAILGIAFYTWYPLTKLALRGDSFVYFIDRLFILYWKLPWVLASFDWSAIALGRLLSEFFGTKISLYFWTELFFLLFTTILFFFLVFVITKKRIVAFSAALILVVNYFGNFDIYAGIYPWFLERIPLMVFLIPSFTFLHLYLEKQKRKYYIWSLLLFFLGVGIAHWGVLFTGPYLFYPIFWQLLKERKKVLLFRAFKTGLVYLLISAFFVSLQELRFPGVGPNWGFLEYLTQPQVYDYPAKIIKQLVYWSSYLPILEQGRLSLNFVEASKSLAYTPQVLTAYIFAAIVIFKKLPAQRALLLAIIFSTLSIFYLNAYFDQYHIDTQPGSNRYLYLPTYLLSLFWTLFLWALFWQKSGKKVLLGLACLALYFFLNWWLIKTSFGFILERHAVTRKVWNYIVEQRPKIIPETLVVIPNRQTGQYEAEFLTDQLGNGEVQYIADVEGWEKIASAAKQAIRVQYDKDCVCVVEEKLK